MTSKKLFRVCFRDFKANSGGAAAEAAGAFAPALSEFYLRDHFPKSSKNAIKIWSLKKYPPEPRHFSEGCSAPDSDEMK